MGEINNIVFKLELADSADRAEQRLLLTVLFLQQRMLPLILLCAFLEFLPHNLLSRLPHVYVLPERDDRRLKVVQTALDAFNVDA